MHQAYVVCDYGGRFGLGGAAAVAAEPHPSSNRIIVVFVIGGMSLLEVQHVQEALDQACREDADMSGFCQIILGTNDVISPANVMEKILL
jgi:hypothetical protein